MKRVLQFIVDKNSDSTDVASFLLSKKISGSCISALKREKQGILVNGEIQFTDYILKESDVVEISLTEENDYSQIIPVKLDFKIIYEDEDIIIIDKPANMTVHPSLKYFKESLENGLTYYFLTKNEDVVCHFINRLDKDTTGLLIVAKNRFSANILSQALLKKEIKREYLALVEGKLLNKSGSINAPIEREKEGSIIRTVDFEKGKQAITNYEVLSYNPQTDVSLLKLELLTGRTHQIRVHMKYLGHPLVGDELYNKTCRQLKRQALHSCYLSFYHPISHKPLSFKSEMPTDFTTLLNKCYNK
ncbi:MAG TPA: RluA family pseudouridine synthase [Erysipelotrichaceae bacterium]|nr:RluA family pseudouridine synthase [Erysipelotrichaceae bacterium]